MITTEENTVVGKDELHVSSNDKKKSSHNCKEYQALKYKTMITTGTNIEKKILNETSEDQINSFLEKEIQRNKNQSWNKLTKTDKLKKLRDYIHNDIPDKYSLNSDEIVQARRFILNLLERKKINKNNEVTYDEVNGKISDIPAIEFSETSRKFIINKNIQNLSKKNMSSSSVRNISKNAPKPKKKTPVKPRATKKNKPVSTNDLQ